MHFQVINARVIENRPVGRFHVDVLEACNIDALRAGTIDIDVRIGQQPQAERLSVRMTRQCFARGRNVSLNQIERRQLFQCVVIIGTYCEQPPASFGC